MPRHPGLVLAPLGGKVGGALVNQPVQCALQAVQRAEDKRHPVCAGCAAPQGLHDLRQQTCRVDHHGASSQSFKTVAVVAAGDALVDDDVRALLYRQGLIVANLAMLGGFDGHIWQARQPMQHGQRAVPTFAVPEQTVAFGVAFVASRRGVGDMDDLFALAACGGAG